LVDVVLGPLFAFGAKRLKSVEFDLVLSSMDKLLLDIVLLPESVIPKAAPCETNISQHRKAICLVMLVLA
jgi:hypothetical protein